MELYFAPINQLSNYVYRHILLENGADFVFSELIMLNKLGAEIKKDKLKFIKRDLQKTIFQIGTSDKKELAEGIKKIKQLIPNLKEINLNMGCPQSTMLQKKVCGGILTDKVLMRKLCVELSKQCMLYNVIPSIKLRLGTDKNNIEINDYLKILQESNINKVYIHARPNKYSYQKPALYNSLANVKKDFSNIKIILNGDIDSYDKYKEVTKIKPDGVMIGRAALSNPLIFKQIKDKLIIKSTKFNPVLNDPNIILINKKYLLSKEKQSIIKDLIALAIKENLRYILLKNNLVYLTKGLTNNSAFMKKVNQTDNIKDIQRYYLDFF
jgi:tRNA-dihydrouridine synthase B